ncbi:MAG: hypothetical protein LPK19_11815 [Hymenobacteraceae bacterium]|nr:hypothetical protein [Hymenobacteraceae bacterium]MDX5396913.1 hypothetical protein [Hymenobacteraceae bacterium]MDX5512987.1 hypothetical protein [Hymenobacteraceae bacterium]
MLKQLLLFLFLGIALFSCKPKCPIESCHVRMVHAHGRGEYRGQPFWKKQNPKIGEKLPNQKGESRKAHNDLRRTKD